MDARVNIEPYVDVVDARFQLNDHGAVFACDDTRRLAWWRTLRSGADASAKPYVVAWDMLNPSTADGRTDDATTRRVTSFTLTLADRLWRSTLHARGLRVIVVNISTMISTDPAGLTDDDDAFAEQDARTACAVNAFASAVVVAWGANAQRIRHRRRMIVDDLARNGVPIYALGRTNDGEPKHPVRLATATPFVKVSAFANGSVGKGSFAHLCFGGPL